ncbi:MAG: AAA family ATPase [Succinivibrionaceae bacterium]|nr:AAA family ATPase [Pseudomonadota bacterium]MDY3145865.1 AAA family ATPase [Succinivibrionaceae bacterium]MDY6273550.1 AAA family ATPase [Succinivibrionaceae bacterium]MDY6337636.1 AAA family ATPase [Succinivibrionaceae bacterium]MDY6375122.1 AAA family ATPase [Succinivibrionaceae bacterium]
MRTADTLIKILNGVLLGKERQIRLAVCCLISGGHLLIEDLPGMGKTTLATGLSSLLGLSFQRVQFTSDMLPADLIGMSVMNRESGKFEFRKGPVFTQVLLADEINRGSPRTQSALLEAMAERQVSVDRETYPLPEPFFVIATQNPQDQSGTYTLPESELDRFMMRIEIGYPAREAERNILLGKKTEGRLDAITDASEIIEIRKEAAAVKASDAALDYIQDLIAASRSDAKIPNPLSPRAAIALLAASRSWAYLDSRDYVIPEDVQAVFPAVAEHRMRRGAGTIGDLNGLSEHILKSVGVSV